LLTCREFLSELNGYLDDDMPPEMRAELQRHMDECPNCWVVVDTTKKTMQVYKGMDPKPVPDAVSSRLMAALARKMAEKKRECDQSTRSAQ